MQMINNKYSKS